MEELIEAMPPRISSREDPGIDDLARAASRVG
jgi:hypothetical protein